MLEFKKRVKVAEIESAVVIDKMGGSILICWLER